jgi:hypothetical protein
MEHFSEQNWVDFVRDAGLPGMKQRVDKHLAMGCPRCQITLAFWKGIAGLAAEERNCTPPAELVHLVKAEFSARHDFRPEAQTFAGMIFDSALQPVTMGLRSARAATRQVVYEAEGLTVDLRFERKQPGNVVSACGQVLDNDAPLSWLGNAAIVLCTGEGRMITRTETNEYGEFQFEFEPQDQLRMSVVTMGRRTLRIALGNLD